MYFNFGLIKLLLILALVDQTILAPSPSSSSSNNHQNRSSPSKLVELKLPVKITSMHDLVAWARNAMRSMASRIDITLEPVNEQVETKNQEDSRISIKDTNYKQKDISKDREENVRTEPKRPTGPNAIVSTYASLLDPEIYSESLTGNQNNGFHDGLSHGNLNAYLPLFLDDVEISRYREEALRKYYLDNEQVKREEMKKENRENNLGKYSQAVGQQTLQDQVNDEELKIVKSGSKKEEKKVNPVISVPFEAIVTITRENLDKPSRASLGETRDPPDEFPPYFEKDYPRRGSSEKIQNDRKSKESSKKRQISTLGDLLRMLGLTKKFNTKENKSDATKLQSKKTRTRKPAERFMPPPFIQFEDQPLRQRRNETSQRQEFDEEEDEEEEDMGSLGSITDLLPLVIPILEDISDPNSDTDLGELLEAALPLVEGLIKPDDPDAPDILGLIGPILTTIIGGKDGQGSDVAAVLGPAITLVAPFIGPILGPLIGPLLSASSNPPQGEGSNLASLLSAVLGPLTQTPENGKMSALSVLVAGVIAALSKELRPGLPGGLDVGAVVSSVLSGVIAGTSGGLSGSLSADKQQPNVAYGPYGAGPIQAGSVNTGTSTGFTFPGPQTNQQIRPQQPIAANIAEHQRIVYQTTRRPYSTLPQRFPSGPQPRPPPPTYVQPQLTGPLPAAATNAGSGDSSYLPYGTSNAVAANTVNPFGLIANLIKDILGAGIQVGSSVINAVFGIIGSSSDSGDEPKPAYGPPPPSSYSQSTG